jgi:Flp pilus assembly protein TadD
MSARQFLLSYLFVLIGPYLSAESRWIRMKSPNFEVYSSDSERDTRETVREFEQVRSFFIQSLGNSDITPLPVKIIVFSSRKEFEPYRINEFASAYYKGGGEVDYIVLSSAGSEAFPTAIHEFVHLLVRHSGMKLPPWLNEGIAELYSTLQPQGSKVLVGTLHPGRMQALRTERWVPLQIILRAGHDSPYYNEKSKAGSLYNEGWALTHMLSLSEDYRPGFPKFLEAIQTSPSSEEALAKVYGKPLKTIEDELGGYIRGQYFRAALIVVKMSKAPADIPVEPVDDVDVQLILLEIHNRPETLAQVRRSLEQLAEKNPTRPEPEVRLGYMALRQGSRDQAVRHFQKAFELNSQSPKMLFDYGRLAEPSAGAAALERLLTLEPDRVDVRIALAFCLLRDHQASKSLLALQPIKKVGKADAPLFFRALTYASLETGNREEAKAAARRLAEVAASEDDTRDAQRILEALKNSANLPPVEITTAAARPSLRRATPPESKFRPDEDAPLSLAGSLAEVKCEGAKARLVLAVDGRSLTFLIDDPAKVTVVGKDGGVVDLSCGPQKSAPVRIEYEPPPPAVAGVDGLVRLIQFQ